MKRVVIIAAAMLAACAGDKDASKPAADEAPTPAQVETPSVKVADAPADKAPNAEDGKLDELIFSMGGLPLDACECVEKTCADSLRTKWTAARAALAEHQPSFNAVQKKRYIKSLKRWLECTAGDPKTQMEMDGIASAACACGKDKDCQENAADGVNDMNKNAKVATWAAPELLADVNKKAISCLLAGGMSASAIKKAGVPAELIKAAKK